MHIGIVGCGKVGKALGSWLAFLDYPVSFTSRRAESAREAAKEAGGRAEAVELATAITSSDLLLLTLPFDAIQSTLLPHKAALGGKVLIDVTNPISADHRQLSVGHRDSGAEQIARALPDAYVIKAFNAVFAEIYQARTPQLGNRTISIFIAGDEPDAKKSTSSLVATLGFDPVDAGPLQNARYLEPLSLLNIQLGRVLGHGTSIGFSLLRA